MSIHRDTSAEAPKIIGPVLPKPRNISTPPKRNQRTSTLQNIGERNNKNKINVAPNY